MPTDVDDRDLVTAVEESTMASRRMDAMSEGAFSAVQLDEVVDVCCNLRVWAYFSSLRAFPLLPDRLNRLSADHQC